MNSKDKTKIFILVLFALIIALRFTFITIDTPHWYTPIQAVFTDEGYKTYNPRNIILFGQNSPNPYDSYPGWVKQSPVSHYLFLWMFMMFGVGYLQARIVVGIISIFSIIMFYIILKDEHDLRFAAVGTAIFGLNFVYLIYSKLALLEPIVTFFLLVSVYFGRKKGIINTLLAIVGFVLAYLTKPLSIFFVPALLFIVYENTKNITKNNKKAIIGIIIAALIAAISVAVFYPEIIMKFLDLVKYHMPSSISHLPKLLRRVLIGPFFTYNLFISLPFFLYAVLFASKIFLKRHIRKIEIIFFLWALFMIALMSLQEYRPIRYFLPMLVAMIYLGMISIKERNTIVEAIKKKTKNKVNFQNSIAFLEVLAVLLVSYFPIRHFYPDIKSMVSLFILIAIILSMIITKKYLDNIIRITAGILKNKRIPAILLILYFASTLIPIAIWFSYPQYTLIDSSKDFAKTIPPDAHVLGIKWANALCMEAKNQCYQVAGAANHANEVFRALNITYLVSDNYHHPDYDVEFLRNPNFEKSITHIKDYRLGRFNITVYKFDKDIFYGTDR